MVKNPRATQVDLGLISGLARSLGDGLSTHSSILAWESDGQRSLVGCSPWGHKESDMTEIHLVFSP